MAFEVKVPRLAESISEGVLVQWLKGDGERVSVDEPVAVLETDKAAVELPAERAGTLHHGRKVGDKVEVGDVIATIDESTATAMTAPAASAPARGAAPAPAPSAPARIPAPGPVPSAPAPGAAPAPPLASAPSVPSPVPPPAYGAAATDADGATHQTLSPAVRRLVDEHGLDPAAIPASGRGGRLLKEDVERHLAARPAAPAPVVAPAPIAPRPAPITPAPVPAPARSEPAVAAAAPAAKPGQPGGEWREGELERAVPMSRVRQRIAERLVQAQHTAAILTTFNEVDMSEVMALRARHKDSFEQRHGVRLSYMSFFGRACILALQQLPDLNARIDGTDIVYQRRVHLGIAVGTDRGLVVPVVHDADLLGFADLEREIARLAVRARDNRLSLAELSGGTFTISNGGVYGSLLSTPILNPPQSGILGMHKIEKRAVVVDDAIVIRPMMYLALSYDHRLVDGEQAVTYLVSVKQRLEDPERMLLDM
jgi:2-oxoglutarate dehydrogenase E2 component (dihydrolipoamide succinyltransferase)